MNKPRVPKGVRRDERLLLCRTCRNPQTSANSKELFQAEVEWNNGFTPAAQVLLPDLRDFKV